MIVRIVRDLTYVGVIDARDLARGVIAEFMFRPRVFVWVSSWRHCRRYRST